MVQLFNNPRQRFNPSLDDIIASLNRCTMPKPYTEGKYTGYRAYELRDAYLWLAIIVCLDIELIRELVENLAPPTGDTWVRYSPFDPEVSSELYRLIEWADIELITFEFGPGVEVDWQTLGDLPAYQTYLQASSNSCTTQPARR